MKTTTIPKWVAIICASASLLAVCSCSSTSQNQAQQSSTMSGADIARGGVVVDAVSGTATVQSIDPDDRTVVLLHPDGTTATYECGPDVRNFDQIKVGDQVTATVAESVAIVLIKGSVPPATGSTTAMVRAPLGAKPGGRIVDTVAFTAKVVSIDTADREVTLQLPDGTNQTVKVGPDVDLTDVNPGDDVGVKMTRAFAISVQSPESRTAAPETYITDVELTFCQK